VQFGKQKAPKVHEPSGQGIRIQSGTRSVPDCASHRAHESKPPEGRSTSGGQGKQASDRAWNNNPEGVSNTFGAGLAPCAARCGNATCSHPDYTVGPGLSPVSCLGPIGRGSRAEEGGGAPPITAGRELAARRRPHPAPQVVIFRCREKDFVLRITVYDNSPEFSLSTNQEVPVHRGAGRSSTSSSNPPWPIDAISSRVNRSPAIRRGMTQSTTFR